MTDPHTLEDALEKAQAEADAGLRLASAVTRELKKVRTSAAVGDLKELTKALAQAESVVAELSTQVGNARTGYDVDAPGLLGSGEYTKELLAAAADADLRMVEEDGRLLCYPSLVRVLPGDQVIEVDRRRERRIRPSVVVAMLARAQAAGPRFRPEPVLASLAEAYDLVVAKQGKSEGAVVRLVDVYAVLTLLPGQSREYSKQEFARDLYLLDQNGTGQTGGRQLRWAASTGTKQAGVLTTVSRSGQQQRYWGISFHRPSHDVEPRRV